MTPEQIEAADRAVQNCHVCGPMEKWTQEPGIPLELIGFLIEQWWYHEDMGDNLSCYWALERAKARESKKRAERMRNG